MEEGRSCLASVGLGRLQKWTFIGNHGERERGWTAVHVLVKKRRSGGGGEVVVA